MNDEFFSLQFILIMVGDMSELFPYLADENNQ